MNRHILAAGTALRCLFSRKSHSAINIISIVSVCGIALASMAMVCVMSVYNGFQEFLGDRVESLLPDVEVRPHNGKVMADADSLADVLAEMREVDTATPVVDDNMLVYRSRSMLPVRVLGVDPERFARVTSVSSIVAPGGEYRVGMADAEPSAEVADGLSDEANDETVSEEFDEAALFSTPSDLVSSSGTPEGLDDAPAQYAVLSSDVFRQLYGFRGESQPLSRLDGTTLIAPRRTGAISTVNPEAAFLANEIHVSGILPADKTDMAANLAVVSLPLARDMLEYTTEAGSVYVKASPGIPPSELAAAVKEKVGEGYDVTDRDSQLTVHFNMMRIEKWITFLLLSFILLIASFNIISTLSMLIVDKRRTILQLRNMGASRFFIGEMFCWESFWVCLSGTLAGLGVGLILCWIQMRYGVIGIMNASENLIIDTYPVRIRWSDVGWLMAPSLLIAGLTATISSRFARSVATAAHN